MADPKSASKNGRETRKRRPPARAQSAAGPGATPQPLRVDAAAALRESEERLRVILDNVQTGVLIIDPSTHTIVDANPTAAALIGTPREQLLGKTCHQHFCPAEVGHCPITDLEQAIDNSERVLLRSDGTRCSILKTVVPILLNGRPHLLENFVDITDRKQAEQAHATRTRQLEALRATTADLTRELDLTRLLRLLIARAAELVGASSATVYLWEPDQEVVVPAAWHGLGDWQATLRHRLGHGIAGTVAATRRSVLANDYRASRYANPVTLQHTAVTASLGEPLLYREELIGAITLNHEGGGRSRRRTRPCSGSSPTRRPSPSRTRGFSAKNTTAAPSSRRSAPSAPKSPRSSTWRKPCASSPSGPAR